ncbi:MAG: hypothetical protein ABSB31_05105 [Dehalococcoidia bacterium]|jgi:hypothetical protein
MAGIDFKKWQYRTILATVVGIIIIVGVLSVTPIFGLNITPQSAQGASYVGGSFGDLVPTLPAHYGYTSSGSG